MSAQPALFNDKSAPRKSAASWSADENQFAAWLMQQWNETVGRVGQKCYIKRRNRFAAIQLYRRLWEQHPTRQAMGGSARQLFSNEEIRAALQAYATCEHNVALKSWKCFHDWCDLGEELIDKQLKRIGYEAPPPPDPKRDAASRIVERRKLHLVAASATTAKLNLDKYLDGESAKYLRARMTDESERQRILSAIHEIAAHLQAILNLPLDAKQRLWDRAAVVFGDYYGSPPRKCLADKNAMRAIGIALALVDREEKQQTAKEPTP